jgi:ectoine hydroxylase-related dioxygenase (phytanoyl-CoA dioxygenase family)
MRDPEVAALANEPALLVIARGAVGAGAVPFRATLFDKSAAANWRVGWHQDTALPLRSRHALPGWGSWSEKEGVVYAHAPASALEVIVAIRVHLDASTSENGPLRVLPGTHALGVLAEEDVGRLAAATPAVECVVQSGGLVVMRPLILHASSKARSGQRRRVIHIEYAASLVLEDGAELAKC